MSDEVQDAHLIAKIRRDNLVRMGDAMDRMFELAMFSEKVEDVDRYAKRVMEILPGLKPVERADPYAGLPTLNISIVHGHAQISLAPAEVIEDVTPKGTETATNIEAAPVPLEKLTIEALLDV